MRETLHLLVVDDELGMRLSIERALRNYQTSFEDIEAEVDFRVTTADSGEAALEAAAQDPPRSSSWTTSSPASPAWTCCRPSWRPSARP